MPEDSNLADRQISRRSFGRLAAAVKAAATLTSVSYRTDKAWAAEGPQPTPHTQQAYDPISSDFAAKWTRADARQIMTQQNDESVPRGENSMPDSVTMPEIPKDFPVMNDEVWVWDTWSLTDEHSNQMSYKGWDVIFSLVAPRSIPFDSRHWSAKIGYFYRKSTAELNSSWTYGGLLFPEDSSLSNTEWSGSTRLMQGNKVRVFYTATTFGTPRPGTDGKPAVLATVEGRISASDEGVGGGVLGSEETHVTEEDLGYVDGDPFAETVEEVNGMGAHYQRGNIVLAWADSKDLTSWTMLPPILTAYGVNDQTERPQMILQDGKYYLFTISHQFTYANGLRGPDGVYGFVGDGIRSDFQPLNDSGLVLGSPTDLNLPADAPESPTVGQNPRQFQAYSHYIQPGGLIQSFIDNVDGRRGGTLSPTVKVNISGETTAVDYSFGDNGLGPYAYIPTNKRKGGVGHYK